MAVDSLGREIVLDEPAILDIGEFGPNQNVLLNFAFEEKLEDARKSDLAEGPSRLAEYSVLSASTSAGAGGAEIRSPWVTEAPLALG